MKSQPYFKKYPTRCKQLEIILQKDESKNGPFIFFATKYYYRAISHLNDKAISFAVG